MITEIFPQVMEHFIAHTHSSKANPTLLIFDNHESHLGPTTNRLAKDNGVHIVTLPPHCSGKMQPLDVGVYRSTKSTYNSELDKWMSNHPGKTVTIYDVAELFRKAFYRSMNPSNICSGFRTTGIVPYNPDAFAEELYLCSLVTDRPNPEKDPKDSENEDDPVDAPNTTLPVVDNTISNIVRRESLETGSYTMPSTSSSRTPPTSRVLSSTSTNSSNEATNCFGPPKASPRKTKGGRKRGRSTILTNTPEMKMIEEKAAEKAEKNARKEIRRKLNFGNNLKENVKVKGVKRGRPKKVNITTAVAPQRKKSTDFFGSASEDEQRNDFNMALLSPDCRARTPSPVVPIKESNFCLIKFITEEDSQEKHYIGQVLQLHDGAYEVSFLRRVNRNSLVFKFPNVPDVTTVAEQDVIKRLVPITRLGTAPQNRQIVFSFDAPSNLY